MRSWWEGAGAGQLQPGWELVLPRGAGHGGGLCMPKGSLHTVPGAWDHGEVQAYRSCTVQGSTRARRCRPRSLAGSPRPLRKTTVGPHSSPTPAGRNTSARPQDCCLPHWPSGQISGTVRPSSGPSPSSSDTSRISSTVSGKLMRCLSLTDCGSRAESEDASLHCTPTCSPLLMPRLGTQLSALALPSCAQRTFAWLLPAPALLHRVLVPVPRGSPGCRFPL